MTTLDVSENGQNNLPFADPHHIKVLQSISVDHAEIADKGSDKKKKVTLKILDEVILDPLDFQCKITESINRLNERGWKITKMSFSAKNGDHGASDFQVITPNKDAANEINSTEIPFSLDELMYIGEFGDKSVILANGRNFTTLGLARWGTRPMVVAFNDSEVFFAPFVGLEAKLEGKYSCTYEFYTHEGMLLVQETQVDRWHQFKTSQILAHHTGSQEKMSNPEQIDKIAIIIDDRGNLLTDKDNLSVTKGFVPYNIDSLKPESISELLKITRARVPIMSNE